MKPPNATARRVVHGVSQQSAERHRSAVSQGLSHTAQGVATQGGGRGLGRDNSARSRSRAGSYAPRWQPQAPGQAGAWPVMATKYAYLGCTHTGWTAGGRASTESAAQAIPQGCMLPEAPLGVGRRLADRHPVLHSRDPVLWCYIPSRHQANRGRDPTRSIPGSAP